MTMLGLMCNETSEIISATKFMDLLPVGSVVRNGCVTEADKHDVFASYFLKIREADGYSWQIAEPLDYKPCGRQEFSINTFRSKDIFLPVQVIRRGQ